MNQVKMATAGASLKGLEGYAVKLDANGNVIPCSATTDAPIGVLEDGSCESVSIALPGSVNIGVKLSGPVVPFQLGKVAADGTCLAATWATGEVVFVQFLQSGVAGDLVLANILQPVKVA